MTHTSSRCWGVIWGLIAVASLAAAVFFNLLVGEEEGEQLESFGDASTETQVVLYVAAGLVGLSILHTGLTRRCTLMFRWRLRMQQQHDELTARLTPSCTPGMIRKRQGFRDYFTQV